MEEDIKRLTETLSMCVDQLEAYTDNQIIIDRFRRRTHTEFVKNLIDEMRSKYALQPAFFYIQSQGRLTPVNLNALGTNTIVFVKTHEQLERVIEQAPSLTNTHIVESMLHANSIMHLPNINIDESTVVVFHNSLLM